MGKSKTTITVRNVDPEVKETLKQEANKKGVTFNKYMNELFEINDPKEVYKKLYEETSHQQAVNIKVMKEMTKKLDDIHKIMKQIEEE
ncbi:hypothetical protein I4131_12265 [Staphylococcus aureus]|nr:hypothetical protein [Staphylococcus aureus]